jgi:hypothetical protein
MRFNMTTLVLASGLASAAGTAAVANNTHVQTTCTDLFP